MPQPLNPMSGAFHESGHAAVAVALKIPLLAVYVGGGMGTKWGGTWADRGYASYLTGDRRGRWTDDDRKALFADVAYFMAGKLAEQVVGQRSAEDRYSQDDDAEIRNVTNWFFGDDVASRQQFVAEAQAEVERFLKDNEVIIAGFAKRLDKTKRVWGDVATEALKGLKVPTQQWNG